MMAYPMLFFKNIADVFLCSLKGTFRTCLMLFKIMIPVSILLIILQQTGWIIYLGNAMSFLMKPLGLPGELGLVWATALLGNIFSGILVLASYTSTLSLTIAQMSILSFIILIAHSLIIETTITYKTGIKILPMVLFRLFVAYGGGMILHFLYTQIGIFQTPATIHIPFPDNADYSFTVKTLQSFLLFLNNTFHFSFPNCFEYPFVIKILNEFQRYITLICLIFCLIFLLEFLKKFGLMKYIYRFFNPFIKWLGINKQMMPLIIIGMTLGLAYGGALIIKEHVGNSFSKKDMFYSIFLLAIFHSVIEDTLLMLSIGGHYSSIIIFRLILTFCILFIIIQFTKKWNDQKFAQFFVKSKMK